MMGWLMIAGFGFVAVGLVLIFVRTDWAAPAARAMIVTGVSMSITDAAIAHGWAPAWWLSGFAVCAAIHRWIDLFLHRGSLPIAPTVDVKRPSTNQKPKA